MGTGKVIPFSKKQREKELMSYQVSDKKEPLTRKSLSTKEKVLSKL